MDTGRKQDMDIHERVMAHLNDFLDGTMGAAQAQELNAHLQDCADCRREYRALKATQELVRHAPVADGSKAQTRVMARFRQAVAAPVANPAPARVAFPMRRALPLGAAMMTAGALCVVMLPHLYPAAAPVTLPDTPILLATAACTPNLPTPDALDQMTSAHAVQSFTIQNGSVELQRETLADVNSRLSSH